MGFQIEDGLGTGNIAQVDSDNRLRTYAIVETEFHHTSEREGLVYSWTAVSADLAAGVGGIYLVNNSSTKTLHVEKMYLWADVVTQFKIWCPATYTAPDGTAIVGVNLNRTSTNVADATCTANETNNAFAAAQTVLTVTNKYDATGVPAAAPLGGQWVNFDGALILGYHHAVEVELVADTAAFEATIFGIYHD